MADAGLLDERGDDGDVGGASYRRLLRHVDPLFLLGLTATPERADDADILGIFDDHVAVRADISRGIEVGRLVPFRYFGIRDEIDYDTIPWRNRRFDPEVLAEAAQTERRMATLWDALDEHRGTRSLVFCCSVAHCDFVAAWLQERGRRVAKVYSAPGSTSGTASAAASSTPSAPSTCSTRASTSRPSTGS